MSSTKFLVAFRSVFVDPCIFNCRGMTHIKIAGFRGDVSFLSVSARAWNITNSSTGRDGRNMSWIAIGRLDQQMTHLNQYVHNELTKLRELIKGKAMKKQTEKLIDTKPEALHEPLNEIEAKSGGSGARGAKRRNYGGQAAYHHP
jgi:hypothetical protein